MKCKAMHAAGINTKENTMTFDKARKEFAQLCPGRYRSMDYRLTEHADGTEEQICRLYVHPSISTKEHATWRKALDEMHELILPEDKPEPVPEITPPQGDDI